MSKEHERQQYRTPYKRPKEKSSQYQYGEKEAVKSQEDDRRIQERARKAGQLAVEATDELLAEIDDILDEAVINREDMVLSFEQKGGQ